MQFGVWGVGFLGNEMRSWAVKWLTALVAAAGLSGAGSAAAVAIAKFSVVLDPAPAVVGGVLSATLSDSSFTAIPFDVFSADLLVTFDPTVLAIKQNTGINGFALGSAFDLDPGASLLPDPSGSGQVNVSIAATWGLVGMSASSKSLLGVTFNVLSRPTNGQTTVSFERRSGVAFADTYFVPLTPGIVQVAAVPEPDQWMTMLLGIGLIGAMVARRRRA